MPMVMGYVVIEITERDISSITPCTSKEEGIEIANRLLRKLIEEDYELDMHTLAEDGAQINGVTCIKSNDLGVFALIFSVVGGGNSFMVDVTEYDKLRSIRAIADDIYHHYGNDIFI